MRVRLSCVALCLMAQAGPLAARTASEDFDEFCRAPAEAMSRLRLLNHGTNGLNQIVAYVLGHAPSQSESIALTGHLSHLDSSVYETREQAQTSLGEMGEVARAELEMLAASDEPELSERARAALTTIDPSLYTRDRQRIAVYKAIHTLLFHEWPLHELRAACEQHRSAMARVTRFMHPLERDILALFLASNLVAASDPGPVWTLARTSGPAAGAAVRVLVGGLSHLYADGFPDRWSAMTLPQPGEVVAALVKTKNPEVARALLWGVQDNAGLRTLRKARGTQYAYDAKSVPYIYNVYLWHRGLDGLGKTSLVRLYKHFDIGTEALMHLWARVADDAQDTIVGRLNWPMQPSIFRLLDALVLPDDASAPVEKSLAENELFVWRAPVPGPFAWYQHLTLEPLDGQPEPTTSLRNQDCESHYYGVVHYRGLDAGDYRLRVMCGAQQMYQRISIKGGVHVLFMPMPETYGDIRPDTMSHRGMVPESEMTLTLEGTDGAVPVSITFQHSETKREVVAHVSLPGVFRMQNIGKGDYRITAQARWDGGQATVGPGTFLMPMPATSDGAIHVPTRSVSFVRPIESRAGARLQLTGYVVFGEVLTFAATPPKGAQGLPVVLAYDWPKDEVLQARLPPGEWNALWMPREGAAERFAPISVKQGSGDAAQRFELLRMPTREP